VIGRTARTTFAAVAAALTVFAGAALAGPSTTDSSGNVLIIDVEVSPPLPRSGATIVYHAFFGNRDGGALPREADNEIKLAKGFRLHGTDFATCPLPEQASEVGQDRCSRRAKVGEGTFEADARPALADRVTGTLEIYNGDSRNGNPTLILLADANVGAETVETELNYEYAGSTLGRLALPEGSASGLFVVTKIELELGAERRGKSYVETPRRCRKVWRFSETSFFEDGGSITARDKVPCVKADATRSA
jgi:hypothetical protein